MREVVPLGSVKWVQLHNNWDGVWCFIPFLIMFGIIGIVLLF